MVEYLFYFALTTVIEYVVVQTILGWKTLRSRVAFSVFIANLVTHPVAYLTVVYIHKVSPHDAMTAFYIAGAIVPVVESFVSVAILRPYGFPTVNIVVATVLSSLIAASTSFIHF